MSERSVLKVVLFWGDPDPTKRRVFFFGPVKEWDRPVVATIISKLGEVYGKDKILSVLLPLTELVFMGRVLELHLFRPPKEESSEPETRKCDVCGKNFKVTVHRVARCQECREDADDSDQT
jgi:hypothetical protein